MKKYDLVVLGGGPAGLAAAVYGRRAGLSVLVVEHGPFGGQIRNTSVLENWPGAVSIGGEEISDNFKAHAEHFGAEFLNASITSLKMLEGPSKIVLTDSGEIEAGAIIVATGARFRKLGVPGEDEFLGRGVSYCAVCDGPFFRNEEVAVIGGGNTAVEEAVYLTKFAQRVHIIHRRDKFRADHLFVERALANEKISVHWDSVVERIAGGAAGVEYLRLKNVKTGQEADLPVAGAFLFVGTSPNAEFLGGLLETVPGGWIKTDQNLAASRPGVWAAGDVRDTDLRQVVTAVADGARAALKAYAYLEAL